MPFHFDVNMFQLHNPAIEHFVLTFAQLAREGLGPRRARADLTGVDQIDAHSDFVQRLLDGNGLCGSNYIAPTSVALDESGEPVSHIQVRFLTPTELKHGQQVVERPEFGILMGRIRDRLSTLSDLYGNGPLPIDFAEFGRRAKEVRMTRCELKSLDVSRLSTKTGQRHSLGGFVGAAEYEGNLAEFVPFLEAARFSGVGRQTTWGKGEIAVREVERTAC